MCGLLLSVAPRETSEKSGHNVKELFHTIGEDAYATVSGFLYNPPRHAALIRVVGDDSGRRQALGLSSRSVSVCSLGQPIQLTESRRTRRSALVNSRYMPGGRQFLSMDSCVESPLRPYPIRDC
eukprot:GHVU01221412.1.p1 GENE.GHVU01221412.1~~GHVU01221412.1.p1  ORF type:complete len:124 (+),score=0.58 GHVU01221412.1:461-832(+)